MISALKKNQNNDVIGFTEIVTTTTPAYKKGTNIYNHVICKKTSLPFFLHFIYFCLFNRMENIFVRNYANVLQENNFNGYKMK
jgi:hypothetical protein